VISFTINSSNREALIEQIKRLEPTILWECTIREKKSKRSTIQNSRYWKLVTEFGKHLGYTADEMHDICRFKFMRNVIEIEGERLPLLNSTTKLTTAQMADYQDNIERWAASLGFIFDE
jgi:hypothetical protein